MVFDLISEVKKLNREGSTKYFKYRDYPSCEINKVQLEDCPACSTAFCVGTKPKEKKIKICLNCKTEF